MQKIGIMGGTFNPVHMGHLIAAQEVLEEMNMDRVLFIPTGNPPHKSKKEVISPDDRYEMVRRAVKNNTGFEVSDIEIKREGETYSYHTLMELHNKYPDAKLYFIIGFDTLKELDTWYRIQEVCKMTDFIVVNRGNTTEEIEEEIQNREKRYNCKFSIVTIPDIQISSTDIRERLKNKRSIKYLVTKEVEEYIMQRELYRDGHECSI